MAYIVMALHGYGPSAVQSTVPHISIPRVCGHSMRIKYGMLGRVTVVMALCNYGLYSYGLTVMAYIVKALYT